MAVIYEPGNIAPLISLGGIVGRPGMGRLIEINNPVVGTDDFNIPANPRRIALLIQRITLGGDVLQVTIQGVGTICRLWDIGQTFQIDDNFPTTSAINLNTLAGNSVTCFVTEISVP